MKPPTLLEACKAALDFFSQEVPNGIGPPEKQQRVTLEERLGLIGGYYVAKQLRDAIAAEEAKDTTL